MIHIVHITNTGAVRIAIYLHLAVAYVTSVLVRRTNATFTYLPPSHAYPAPSVPSFLSFLVCFAFPVSLYYWIKKVTHFFLPFPDNPPYSQQTAFRVKFNHGAFLTSVIISSFVYNAYIPRIYLYV